MTPTTIYVDAAFCQVTKSSGWGAYILPAGETKGVRYSGYFARRRPTSSTEAEAMAATNALWHAVNKHPAEAYVVKTDCRNVADAYNGVITAKKLRKYWQRFVDALNHVRGSAALQIVYVPGHASGMHDDAKLNRLCDRMALRARQQDLVSNEHIWKAIPKARAAVKAARDIQSLQNWKRHGNSVGEQVSA